MQGTVLIMDTKTGRREESMAGYSVEWTSWKLSRSSAMAVHAAGRSVDIPAMILDFISSQLRAVVAAFAEVVVAVGAELAVAVAGVVAGVVEASCPLPLVALVLLLVASAAGILPTPTLLLA